MLAAMLLLSLLPGAMFVLGDGDDGENPEHEADEPEVEQDPVSTDLVGEVEDEPETPGTIYRAEETAGQTILSDFKPNADQLILDAVTEDAAIGIGSGEGGAELTIEQNETESTVLFPNLDDVPVDDISVALQLGDVDEALEPLSALLTDTDTALSSNVPEPDVASSALDPTDPDLPDPTPPVPDDAAPVEPNDPDAPDDIPDFDPDAPVLQPNDPDAPEDVASGASLLDLMVRDASDVPGQPEASAQMVDQSLNETVLSPNDDAYEAPALSPNSGDLTLDEGTPVIQSEGDVAVIDANAGDDHVSLGSDPGFAFGGEGADTLFGGDAVAALYGGEGDDVLTAGSGGDFLHGGTGNDTLTGGDGDDVIDGGAHQPSDQPDDDTIHGGVGDDVLHGGTGADVISGGAGDDILDGYGAEDTRSDIEAYDRSWFSDGEADTLSGDAGDDTLIMDAYDTATGGAGHDAFWLHKLGGDEGEFADITDFKVGEDFLRVTLDTPAGATDDDAPALTVEAAENGTDSLVRADGDLVAILRGAADATASDVHAEYRSSGFA